MTAPDVNGFGAYIREVDAQGVTRIVGGRFFTQEEISTGPTALYEASSGWPKASREAMLLFGTAMDVDRRGGLWMTTVRSFDPDGSEAGPALLRLKSALPGYGLDGAKIPREGGGLVDVFSASGKHARESEQRLASGRWFKQRAKREAELADPEDPMSWTRLRGEQWAGERGPWVSELVRDERRVVRTSPLGRTSWTVYDAQGRVIERGAPGVEPTRYSYDAQGRVTERAQGARRVEARYGADGLVEELEDALGQITKLTRDAVGRPTQVEEVGTGRVWGQAYDAQGQRTMLTPPGSGEHVWSYSAVGRLVASALPEAAGRMAKLLWRYDRDGLPVEATQEDGSKAQRVYDAAGRLERVTQGAITRRVGYKAQTGQLERVEREGVGAVEFEWEGPLLRAQVWSGQVSQRQELEYDVSGLLSTITLGSGPQIELEYDEDALPVRVGELELGWGAELARLCLFCCLLYVAAPSYSGIGSCFAPMMRLSF